MEGNSQRTEAERQAEGETMNCPKCNKPLWVKFDEHVGSHGT